MPPATRIAPRTLIDGAVVAREDLIVAGHLRGRLESEHAVLVEPRGVLQARCRVRDLRVQGIVLGDVVASGDVIVEATGQVQGSIRALRLTLVAGGRIAGEVITGPGADTAPAPLRAAEPRFASPRPEPAPGPPPEPSPQPEPEPGPQPEPSPQPEPEPEPEPDFYAPPEATQPQLQLPAAWPEAGPDPSVDGETVEEGGEVVEDDDEVAVEIDEPRGSS